MNSLSQSHYAEYAATRERQRLTQLDTHHVLPVETERSHPVRYVIGQLLIRFGEWLAPPTIEPAPRVSTSQPC